MSRRHVCYSSPHFKANPGSFHGYTTSATTVRSELGTEADYDAFCRALRRRIDAGAGCEDPAEAKTHDGGEGHVR